MAAGLLDSSLDVLWFGGIYFFYNPFFQFPVLYSANEITKFVEK